jgi:2-(1,2-epoxy-1,2-dihydrophenyl)acetyl-CoA isomerase
MSESYVVASQSGAVRTLTMNRPSTLNRLDDVMNEQLLRAMDAAAADTAVRCLVLTGGARVFSIGRDLSNPVESQGVRDRSSANHLACAIGGSQNPLVIRLHSMPMPLIAAVSGKAAGTAVSLALNCDLVIAAKSATFLQPFGQVGLIPDAGSTWLMPRLVGRARALGWTLLGDSLRAEDAVRIGLIWGCFPDRTLDSVVRSVGQRLAAMPIKAAVEARKAMDAVAPLTLQDALLAEARIQHDLEYAHDYRESVAAHLANRSAVYTDR